ncbi:MAG: prolipoprotein diacylglyceryl transferase [Alphaproteobacteria bacterium]
MRAEAVPFPDIDPVAIQIGPLAIRWYALAFIAGLLAGWSYILYVQRREPRIMTREEVADFFTWAIIGVVAGGRLGYVTFYMAGYFLQNPLEIFFLWQGGMSFHGGLIGMVIATVLFCRRRGLPILSVADLVACAAPIGLFLGRIANFINGELYGRTTDVPWAIVFPGAGTAARHPSQLYEAALEGLVLFVVLFALARFTEARRRPGLVAGIFFTGYGISRVVVELYREPDAHIGYLLGGVTMGQLLSVPVLFVGVWLITRARRTPARAT